MKKAIITIQGKQHNVQEGETVVVDRISENETKKLAAQVNLFTDQGKILIGNPTLSNIKVELEKISDFQGKKIKITKFHRRKRFFKRQGHRQQLSKVLISAIKLEN